VEWTRTDLILDVRNGDLFEERDLLPWEQWEAIKRQDRDLLLTLRWTTIALQAAEPAAAQQQKLGAVDWDAEWNEDVARREKGQLPNEKAYVRELETRIKERYGVTSVDGGDLRRFKVALYRGDPERPKRRRTLDSMGNGSKRKKTKHKG
jgi:hypothetical protein